MANQRKKCDNYCYEILIKNPCCNCGEKNIALLDFAHIDASTKLTNVSTLRNQGKFEEMIFEITKCKILCSNCHRNETAKERNWNKTIKFSEEELNIEKFDNDTIESLNEFID